MATPPGPSGVQTVIFGEGSENALKSLAKAAGMRLAPSGEHELAKLSHAPLERLLIVYHLGYEVQAARRAAISLRRCSGCRYATLER